MFSARHFRKVIASVAATASVAVVAVVLSASWFRAQAGEAAAPAASPAIKAPRPYADRFPNLVLKTHTGRNVRFYDDLIKGKIVMINFMYATCKGT